MVELNDVVVYVLDGEGDLDLLDPHLLQLQAGHRAGGVLQEDLVYPDACLLAWLEVAFLQVILEDLGNQIIGHTSPLTIVPLTYGLIFSQLRMRGSPV